MSTSWTTIIIWHFLGGETEARSSVSIRASIWTQAARSHVLIFIILLNTLIYPILPPFYIQETWDCAHLQRILIQALTLRYEQQQSHGYYFTVITVTVLFRVGCDALPFGKSSHCTVSYIHFILSTEQWSPESFHHSTDRIMKPWEGNLTDWDHPGLLFLGLLFFPQEDQDYLGSFSGEHSASNRYPGNWNTALGWSMEFQGICG